MTVECSRQPPLHPNARRPWSAAAGTRTNEGALHNVGGSPFPQPLLELACGASDLDSPLVTTHLGETMSRDLAKVTWEDTLLIIL
jgi:hypothetical protein